MQKVTFYASQVEMAQVQPNDIYMSVLMRMFSTRPNRNGFAVSEGFIDNIIANSGKYTCLPQCADACRLRLGDTTGLTHMLDAQTGQFQSEQIGSFFSFAKAADEFGVSLIGEARIPKRDLRLCETILRMYEAGALAFSFEIEVACLAETDGIAVIDAAEGNELIGMALVSTPAYPEATALMLVAETEDGKDDGNMDEKDKKIAELEAKMMLAEQQSENDEEMRRKEDELEEEKRQREQAEASLAAANEQLMHKDARIAELEAQVTEFTPFKAEAEQLRADKAAAELAAKQQELTRFAEAQGLDIQAEAVAEAIRKADYAALVAEALREEKPAAKPVIAAYAMSAGIAAKGEYDDLLGRA